MRKRKGKRKEGKRFVIFFVLFWGRACFHPVVREYDAVRSIIGYAVLIHTYTATAVVVVDGGGGDDVVVVHVVTVIDNPMVVWFGLFGRS